MNARRERVSMTPEGMAAYLAGQCRVVLVTNGAYGWPHPVPMHYGLDEEGRFLLTTFARSQKVRNLERDPRATLLIDSGETYAELKGVMVKAEAEILRDPDEIARLMPLVRAPGSIADSMTGEMSAQVRESLAKRAILRLTPRSFASWDHSRLGGRY